MKLKIILIAVAGLLLCSCNNHPDNKLKEKEKKTKEIFITGIDGLSREVLETIVKESEILKGGYVLLIPVGIPENDERLGNLKVRIEKVCPNAVHILELKYNSPELLPSQLVMVEGAKLIFFLGNRLGRFMNAPWSQDLTQVIRETYNSGTTIVGINKAGALVGEKIISGELQSSGAMITQLPPDIKLQNGLNLVPGFIFDCIYSNSIVADENAIRDFINKIKKTYVGVPSVGAIFLKEDNFVDLGENKTVVKLSGPNAEWTNIKGLNQRMTDQD
ncbi:MAG: hypothetical protein K9H58_17455 [Bacteroidales bacterium]|nr:hypothetical protein [Bacteroidales bacterium]